MMHAPAPDSPRHAQLLAPPMRWIPHGINRGEPMDAEGATIARVRTDLLGIHDRLADFRPGVR